MSERVTIGVPVYHGEAYLAETLASIEAQTHADFDVVLSVDGPDPACEAICRTWLTDSRFRMVVQPERLGWVGNLNWLLTHVEGDFWYYHQQDDLVLPAYIETLLEHARAHSSAALVYCDVIPIGHIDTPFVQPPSVGGATAFARMMTILHEHFPAFAFRGLTRAAAVVEAGAIPVNDFDNFGVDTCWLAGVARAGELLRVPQPLYRKRYHSANTESKWWAWPEEKRLAAWSAHCVDLLEQALRIEATIQERRLLWTATLERLTSSHAAGYFLTVSRLTRSDRRAILTSFLERARASLDLPSALDARWEEIEDWTRGFYWMPDTAPYEIEDFGPRTVACGAVFNPQPDGSSAIWVRLSRDAEPGLALRVGDTRLETVPKGRLLTACVPARLTKRAGRQTLLVVDTANQARCQPVELRITRP